MNGLGCRRYMRRFARIAGPMTAPRKPRKPAALAPAVRVVPRDVLEAVPSAPEMARRVTFLVHRISARIASIGNRHFRAHATAVFMLSLMPRRTIPSSARLAR